MSNTVCKQQHVQHSTKNTLFTQWAASYAFKTNCIVSYASVRYVKVSRPLNQSWSHEVSCELVSWSLIDHWLLNAEDVI